MCAAASPEAPSFSAGLLAPRAQFLTGTWAATFQDRPPFPESCESAKDREISGTRLLKGCDHPSKGLLLGDISEESREAAAWTLILLGAF